MKSLNGYPRILLTDCNVICAAGSKFDLLQGLRRSPRDTLRIEGDWLKDRPGYFGSIELPQSYQDSNMMNPASRTCQILYYLADQMADSLARLKSRYAPDRVGVIIGTTTTGMREVESCRSVGEVNYHQHQELAVVAENLAAYCGLRGPNLVVSTACTSGAKAMGLARTLITAGWCDAVLTGASESLNKLTCQGFDALESYSMGYCKPFQSKRDGINIGEGAALFVMEKGDSGIALLGFAESSDAWHESAPHPEGVGAEQAIRAALAEARLDCREIGYINLHGTGTRLNDTMEARVIQRIFGTEVAASSTKSVTGHILGAAAAVEAAILWLLLEQRDAVRLPPQHGVEYYDSSLPQINLVRAMDNPLRAITAALSVSFAFGGHNTALVLARVEG